MKFSQQQTAFANLALHFGDVTKLIRGFREPDEDGKLFHERLDLASRSEARIVQLAGESDVLLALDFKRFKHLFRAHRHFRDRHLSCHWTLCKVFHTPRLADPCAVPGAMQHSEHACFFLHLRLYRQIYRLGGSAAEAEILTQVEERLSKAGIPARIYASLGWTDLLVEGYLPEGREQLPGVLEKLRQVSYQPDGGKPLNPFQRTITRVGYRWDFEDEPVGELTTPYTLRLRARPGQLGVVKDRLTEFFGRSENGGSSPQILTTEGKADVLVVPDKEDYEGNRYPNIHLNPRAREEFLRLKEVGVEYIESYLAAGALALGSPTTMAVPNHACNCAKELLPLQFNEFQKRILPLSIRASIRRIYDLIGMALRDPVQCCDISTMAQAFHQSAAFLLRRLDPLGNEDLGRAAERYEWVRKGIGELGKWCEIAESVLDERTNETFHETIAQSTRLGALRGNVQKPLLTCDFLVREFVQRIEKHLAIDPDIVPDGKLAPPVFYYGATDEISIQYGVVTIPGKYLFSMPLSMPQLWQETGVWVFNQLYPTPVCDKTYPRLLAFIEGEEEAFENLMDRAREVGTGEEVQDLMAEASEIPSLTDLLLDLADHYADLLVRFFGFEAFTGFFQYAITLVLQSSKYREAPPEVQKKYGEKLVQRLLFVMECEEVLVRPRGSHRLLLREKSPFHGIPLRKESVDHQKRAEYVPEMVEVIRKMVAEWLRNSTWSTDEVLLDKALYRRVADRAIRGGYQSCHLEYMWDFIESVAERKRQTQVLLPDFVRDDPDKAEKLEQMRSAEVCELSSGSFLSTYLSEGYLEEVRIRCAETPEVARSEPQRNQGGMAALGRSVMLAFCRQGNGGQGNSGAGETDPTAAG